MDTPGAEFEPRGQPDVAVRGIWLRKLGDQIQVLAEGDDGWHLVIEEHEDGPFSHIVEPAGIRNSPLTGEPAT